MHCKNVETCPDLYEELLFLIELGKTSLHHLHKSTLFYILGKTYTIITYIDK